MSLILSIVNQALSLFKETNLLLNFNPKKNLLIYLITYSLASNVCISQETYKIIIYDSVHFYNDTNNLKIYQIINLFDSNLVVTNSTEVRRFYPAIYKNSFGFVDRVKLKLGELYLPAFWKQSNNKLLMNNTTLWRSGKYILTSGKYKYSKEGVLSLTTEPKSKSVSRTDTNTRVYLDFVGSGDIQKSISEGKDINANTGIGIFYERYNGSDEKIIQSFELEATINIASTADSLSAQIKNSSLQNQRIFGTYVLNPISTLQSININSNIYFGYPKNDNGYTIWGKIAHAVSGANVRVISSNNVWRYNNTAANLGVISVRGGIFHEFVPDNFRLNQDMRSRYSIFFGINYTYRRIIGDLSSRANTDLRRDFLGQDEVKFKGIELNFGFRLNNLRAEFQMPNLVGQRDKGSPKLVDGLTNRQFLFSIKFIGGFSLKLDPERFPNPGTGKNPSTPAGPQEQKD